MEVDGAQRFENPWWDSTLILLDKFSDQFDNFERRFTLEIQPEPSGRPRHLVREQTGLKKMAPVYRSV